MIDQDLKNRIIENLSKHYSMPIIEYLTEKEIFNARGEAYSPESIRGFVNAFDGRENLKVESAIIELLEIKIKEKQKIAKRKKQLKE